MSEEETKSEDVEPKEVEEPRVERKERNRFEDEMISFSKSMQIYSDKFSSKPDHLGNGNHDGGTRVDDTPKQQGLVFGILTYKSHASPSELKIEFSMKPETMEEAIKEIKEKEEEFRVKYINIRRIGNDNRNTRELEENKSPDEKYDISHEKDIELVMSQAECSKEDALKALKENDWDIVNAIMKITYPHLSGVEDKVEIPETMYRVDQE